MKTPLISYIETLLDLAPVRDYGILDIGCGGGELLARLSQSVGKASSLVGIDVDERSIGYARNAYPDFDFRCDKFEDRLDFDDDSFDLVVSVDTLECIPDKNALLDEVARILKPGGMVLFAHWDWETQVYHSEHRDIIRKFVTAFADWEQDWMDASDGQMGRKLRALFDACGHFEGETDCFTLIETEFSEGCYGFDRLRDLSVLVDSGELDATEYAKVSDEMVSLSQKRMYLYSLNSYIYHGKVIST